MSDGPESAGGELRNCDIVMKGGITSGVVYPAAVYELSKAFRFRNIGGTSAGAIAAAATAAAEYGRREKRGRGFEGLAELPRQLTERLASGESRLFSLFQPGEETRPLFRVLVAALGPAKPWRKAVRTTRAVLSSFPEGAWLGALPGLLPAIALVFALLAAGSIAARFGFAGAFLCTLALAGVGALLGAVAALAVRALQAIPAHDFGLCRGYDFARTDPSHRHGPPPLTEWLADLLDGLAGKSREEPLTFGDLEGPQEEGAIHLEVMTSCVTLGRPFRLPFEDTFYFRRSDLERFFPPRIVRWLAAHPDPEAKSELRLQTGEPLIPLPAARHLPVIVAVRMSLSFPLLISAVPLYGVDWTRGRPGEDAKSWGIEVLKNGTERRIPPPEPCWFSDGGLASNLPIHFFDSPLPRWPALAIDLIYEEEEEEEDEGSEPADGDPCRKVLLPKDNRGGLLKSWARLKGPGWGGPLVGFVASLINVMQNWRDETQARMPGYRDRIAHILMGKGEGGMNLSMPKETLGKLTTRGQCAGAMLRDRFAGPGEPTGMSWDNHRWVRYRAAMSALENLLVEFERAYDDRTAGERTYEELVLRGRGEPPRSYPLGSETRKERFAEMTRRLVDFARELESDPCFTEARPPRPRGELRVVPRV
jgi:predicted acylesterase/phospholipase RssA